MTSIGQPLNSNTLANPNTPFYGGAGGGGGVFSSLLVSGSAALAQTTGNVQIGNPLSGNANLTVTGSASIKTGLTVLDGGVNVAAGGIFVSGGDVQITNDVLAANAIISNDVSVGGAITVANGDVTLTNGNLVMPTGSVGVLDGTINVGNNTTGGAAINIIAGELVMQSTASSATLNSTQILGNLLIQPRVPPSANPGIQMNAYINYGGNAAFVAGNTALSITPSGQPSDAVGLWLLAGSSQTGTEAVQKNICGVFYSDGINWIGTVSAILTNNLGSPGSLSFQNLTGSPTQIRITNDTPSDYNVVFQFQPMGYQLNFIGF